MHSSLKTEPVDSVQVQGLKLVRARLQWAKDDVAFSVHVSPNQWSTSGMQLTDALGYLGFQRQGCAFADTHEAYCDWIEEGTDLGKLGAAITAVHGQLREAQQRLQSCGLHLPQPEGYGYFFGKTSGGAQRVQRAMFGDGHSSPKTEFMNSSEDDAFQFAFTWIEGGLNKGWTTHYRPKRSPFSTEVQAAFEVLGLVPFNSCPSFDFEPCYWMFRPFESRGDSPWDSNAEFAHSAFGSLAQSFSPGIQHLLGAQATAESIGRSIFRMPAAPGARAERDIERATIRPAAPKQPNKEYEFDIAVSFAGTERQIAEEFAKRVQDAGFSVFCDSFYPEMLWGKNLVEFFDEIYRKRARYCVMFISPEYRERMWTQHERRSAQARALEERGNEYILPIVAKPADLPGMQPTVGYLSLSEYPVSKVAEITIKKLRA
ncbi:MAG TPA: TIR domain-containing protein [Terriglobales bacterium]|nr:TIR domain-containing protein [Terriglobales bacterium]